MIGVILLAISWCLLRLERKSLSALGFDRPCRRASEFGAGFFLAGAFVTVQQLLSALPRGYSWERNPDLGWGAALDGLRFNVNSVLFEEFLFRGYLLYQAIRFFGPRKGVGLSAIAFGVYHWFSYGVIGDPVAMAFVFLLTGVAGLNLGLTLALPALVLWKLPSKQVDASAESGTP